MSIASTSPAAPAVRGPLVHRQSIWTRIAHWTWAACLFFLLLSGLNILSARPDLYIGQQSGFGFDNSVLSIGARVEDEAFVGVTTIFGREFETTGWLGAIDNESQTFPGWAMIPSYRDLGTARVVHFFFAWIFLGALVVWWVASLLNRHVLQLVPRGRDLRALPGDIANHARLRFHHTRDYNVLQKLSYAGVMFVAFPLMVLTGLSMSPSFNAAAPWLLDVFGGRQTARTVHFAVMLLLVAFVVVHVLMVVLAGPINELRSMVTGWYRIDPEHTPGGPRNGR